MDSTPPCVDTSTSSASARMTVQAKPPRSGSAPGSAGTAATNAMRPTSRLKLAVSAEPGSACGRSSADASSTAMRRSSISSTVNWQRAARPAVTVRRMATYAPFAGTGARRPPVEELLARYLLLRSGVRDVPTLDDRRTVLPAEHGGGSRSERQPAAVQDVEPDPAGPDHPADVPVRDEDYGSVGQVRKRPPQHPVGAGGHLGRGLAAGNRMRPQ